MFTVIAAEKATNPMLSVTAACRCLGVSTSGYYDWLRAQTVPCARRRSDAALAETVREIHRQSRGTYGVPRVHAELRLGLGIRVGRKRIERLMRAEGLQGVTRRRRRGTTRRDPHAVPNDDLVARRFSPEGPNQLWVADITEHPSAEGKVYCAVVLDAWERARKGNGTTLIQRDRLHTLRPALRTSHSRTRTPNATTAPQAPHARAPQPPS